MSEQYRWKKVNERKDLDRFVEAYADATGKLLKVVNEREAPDFLCEKENGEAIGVELTKIISSPETRLFHQRWGNGPIDFLEDIITRIFEASEGKAKKLRKIGWATANTLLVIQLFDNPLSEAHRALERMNVDDLAEFEFSEIWVADHSTLDAYDCLDLFGVYPETVAGYYALTNGRKPYG